MLKIDVEGMEKRVLHGFTRMLAEKDRRDPIRARANPCRDRRYFENSAAMVHEFGYTVWAIFPNGARIITNTGANPETFRGRNLLAAREGLQSNIKKIVVGAC